MCRVISFGENCPGESDFGRNRCGQVFSPPRITLEYNGKILPRDGAETGFAKAIGGGRETGVEPSPPRNILI